MRLTHLSTRVREQLTLRFKGWGYSNGSELWTEQRKAAERRGPVAPTTLRTTHIAISRAPPRSTTGAQPRDDVTDCAFVVAEQTQSCRIRALIEQLGPLSPPALARSFF